MRWRYICLGLAWALFWTAPIGAWQHALTHFQHLPTAGASPTDDGDCPQCTALSHCAVATRPTALPLATATHLRFSPPCSAPTVAHDRAAPQACSRDPPVFRFFV